MKDIIYTLIDIHKPTSTALSDSVSLTHLKKAGVLSIFSVAAFLGTESVQATTPQAVSFSNLTATSELSESSETIKEFTPQYGDYLLDNARDFEQETVLPISNDLGDFHVTNTNRTPPSEITSNSSDEEEDIQASDTLTPISSSLQSAFESAQEFEIVDSSVVFQPLDTIEHSHVEVEQLQASQTQPEPSVVLPTQTITPSVPIHSELVPTQPVDSATPIHSELNPPAPEVEVSDNSLKPYLQAQTDSEDLLIPENDPEDDALSPSLQLQGVVITQDDTAARLRVSGIYPVSPHALFGATVDLTTGDGLTDSPTEGLNLNELYFAGSLPDLPQLRLLVGQLDLTSYFDRNSFAKDGTTHFFNPIFQTNPALTAAGIGSRPAILLNYNLTDNVEARVVGFSSARNLGDLALDAFAGEVAFRAGTAILRATYVNARDAKEDGFREIFDINRNPDSLDFVFGPDEDDREQAFGINGEVFIPDLNMGLFARYGWYENLELDEGGSTFSLGISFLDLFMQDDRLGLGYGQALSNSDLRRDRDDKIPDVWELFYDFRITPNLRAGVTLQGRDQFSETIFGVRLKTDFNVNF